MDAQTLNTRSNIILGVFLIILGLLLLLRNFGLFDFNLGDLFRLWPFILIYFGVRMLPVDENKRVWLETAVIILFFISLVSLPYLSKKSRTTYDEDLGVKTEKLIPAIDKSGDRKSGDRII
jgi:hypothetical protein